MSAVRAGLPTVSTSASWAVPTVRLLLRVLGRRSRSGLTEEALDEINRKALEELEKAVVAAGSSSVAAGGSAVNPHQCKVCGYAPPTVVDMQTKTRTTHRWSNDMYTQTGP